MEITLQIDQGAPIVLPRSVVEDTICFMEDLPSFAHFFEELSQHASSQIRSTVAAKSYLSVSVYECLANDPSIEVVQAIVCNEDAMKLLCLPTIQSMIRRDVSIAKALLSAGLDCINPSFKDDVIEELLKYDDPAVVELIEDMDEELS